MMGQLIRFSIRYPGVIVGLSLLVIAYGIYQRESEEFLRARLDLIKSRMDYNSTGRDIP